MLSYYYPISENDLTYSLDMLRFKFKIVQDSCFSIINYLESFSHKHTFSSKPFNYRELFTIYINNDASFSVGLCFNGLSKKDFFNCFIQFNPNKTGYSRELSKVLLYLRSCWTDCELVNYDIAIDIPCKRSEVFLQKDRRVHKKFSYDATGENVTEYLGVDSGFGRCKLYNKTIESKLDYTLTRLEVTSDKIDYELFMSQFPDVSFFRDLDIFDYVKLSKTDLVLLKLLSMSDDPLFYFRQLGKDKQKTLQPFLFVGASRVGISRATFDRLMRQIKFFKTNQDFS